MNLVNRWVFKARLNAFTFSLNLMACGSEFHSMGPATAKARLPNVSQWNFGTIRTHALFDLREYLELVLLWSMLVM